MFCQQFHIHKFFSLQILCNGRRLDHMDPGRFPFSLNILKCLYIINCRLRICHTDNRRKSAISGSLCSGLDVLFISKARISEMYMGIDQPRCNHQTFRIDHANITCTILFPACFRIYLLFHFCDHRTINQHIKLPICICHRIHNPAVLY